MKPLRQHGMSLLEIALVIALVAFITLLAVQNTYETQRLRAQFQDPQTEQVRDSYTIERIANEVDHAVRILADHLKDSVRNCATWKAPIYLRHARYEVLLRAPRTSPECYLDITLNPEDAGLKDRIKSRAKLQECTPVTGTCLRIQIR